MEVLVSHYQTHIPLPSQVGHFAPQTGGLCISLDVDWWHCLFFNKKIVVRTPCTCFWRRVQNAAQNSLANHKIVHMHLPIWSQKRHCPHMEETGVQKWELSVSPSPIKIQFCFDKASSQSTSFLEERQWAIPRCGSTTCPLSPPLTTLLSSFNSLLTNQTSLTIILITTNCNMVISHAHDKLYNETLSHHFFLIQLYKNHHVFISAKNSEMIWSSFTGEALRGRGP